MPNPIDSMDHKSRLVLAMTLCMIVLFGFSILFPPPPPSTEPGDLPGLEGRRESGYQSDPNAAIDSASGEETALAPPPVPSSSEETRPEPRTEPVETALITEEGPIEDVTVDTPAARYVFSTQGASLRSLKLKNYWENDPPIRLLEAERDNSFDPATKAAWQARIDDIATRDERLAGRKYKKGKAVPESAWVELVPQLGDSVEFPFLLRFGGGESDRGFVYRSNRETVNLASDQTEEVVFTAILESGITIKKVFSFSGSQPAFEVSVSTEAETGGVEAVRTALGGHWILEWPDGLGHLPYSFKGSQENNQLYALLNDSKDNSPTLRSHLDKQAPRDASGMPPANYRSPLEGRVDWVNVETRYFLASFLPQGLPMQGVFAANGLRERLAIDTRVGMGVVSEISEAPRKVMVYAGPKLTAVLREVGGAKGLERVVYDSWFGTICLLVEWLLGVFYGWVPSYGVAIVFLCIVSKIVLYPITYKQAQTQMKMAALQPKIKELQERYKEDKQKLSQEQMKLWKKHGVNPMGGCLPMLAQIPIFIALYRTIQSSIDLRGASFLWIDDLSLPDMTFFLPFSLPFLGSALNILPFIMTAITMVQMKQQAKTMPDPSQAQMMTFMPILIFFMLYNFSSGLVLYWTANSLTQWIQQKMMERLGHSTSPEEKMRLAQASAAGGDTIEVEAEAVSEEPPKKTLPPPQRQRQRQKKKKKR